MTETQRRHVLTLCERAADAWSRGRYDLVTKWLIMAWEIVGAQEFVDR